MAKKKRCAAATAFVFTIWTAVLLIASYLGIVNMSRTPTWVPIDYWLAWFSSFTMIGGVLTGIVASIAAFAALDCSEPQA